MDLSKSKTSSSAFTIIELLTVISIIAILAALLMPSLNKAQMRARRVWCENDLRQLGIGFQIFAHDHNSKFPMAVPMSDGGSLEFTENGYLVNGPFYFSYRHFQTLSNLIVVPKLLDCPSDKSRQAAVNFGTMQNSNLSYFVGADADYFKPMSLLAGDGNLVAAANSPTILYELAGARLQWTRDMHVSKGNVLFTDSHVEEWGNAGSENNLVDQNNLILPTVINTPIINSPPSSPSSPNPPPSSPSTPSAPANPSTPTTPVNNGGGGSSSGGGNSGGGTTPITIPSPNPPSGPSPTAPVISSPSAPSSGNSGGNGSNTNGMIGSPFNQTPMPAYVGDIALSANKKQASGGRSYADSMEFSNNLEGRTNHIHTITNYVTDTTNIIVISRQKTVELQKVAGWSFLFLLLLLLLLLYIAYRTWQESRKNNQKKPPR